MKKLFKNLSLKRLNIQIKTKVLQTEKQRISSLNDDKYEINVIKIQYQTESLSSKGLFHICLHSVTDILHFHNFSSLYIASEWSLKCFKIGIITLSKIGMTVSECYGVFGG